MLQNLNEIVTPIKNKLDRFESLDCELSNTFKESVHQIGSNVMTYGRYNSCATNTTGQRIFISNTWFYIAAILAPLYIPFHEYRNTLRNIVDDRFLKDKDFDKIASLINSSKIIDESDKSALIRFATDQQWWNGGMSSTGKTLDRNDCLASSVLAIANVVNASQGFIVDIWKYFGEHPEMADLLSIENTSSPALQKIYFGNPGSGKSYKVETETKGKKVFRTTFHPDSDYSTFVGTYKPESDGDTIRYTFVPQTFTNAYIEAYKDIGTPVYLIIEEINRGNCAQIFGDLFQLLDRGADGFSEYSINADKDLRDYIRCELATYNGIDTDPEGIKDGKLRLPPNLHILATMNTSDQSLFPMDSAFKRRWDWEYVPIQYKGATSNSFTITLRDKKFRWIDFLKAVNDRIRRVTESEDKQLGNYFIKSDIKENEFKSKVMFYLWSEVCKDEYLTEQNFMRSMTKNSIEKLNSEKPTEEFFRAHISEYEVEEFSFNDLFTERGSDLLLGFMYSMNVLPTEIRNETQEP